MKIYKKLENNNFLKATISYQKGGMNYFNGSNESRGIYLTIRTVERVQHDGYATEGFAMLGTDPKEGKILIEELKRANNIKLLLFCEILEKEKEKIFYVYENNFTIENLKNIFVS